MKVNEANLLYTVRNEKIELSVIDQVLIPETASLSRVLKRLDNKRTTIFRRSVNIFNNKFIKLSQHFISVELLSDQSNTNSDTLNACSH